MINRESWKLTNMYLEYREMVDQLCGGSLLIEKTHIRYILEWAGERSFKSAENFRPTLPEYLLTSRLDGMEYRLSADYMRRILSTARRFFDWLRNNKGGYRSISQGWISTLKPKRVSDPPKKPDTVSFEYVIDVSAARVENTLEERIRAAAIFLFLSGMRIGAFVSLPVKAIDIKAREVMQFPNIGVRTKNNKYAVTYLWNIPELIDVIDEWDKKVRKVLSENGYWFAPFIPGSHEIDSNAISIGEHRANIARKNLIRWTGKVGLSYHKPHAFRYGHIQYGMRNSRDLEEFKAVSMNVMHSSMATTDEIYSRLRDDDLKASIDTIGNRQGI